MGTRHRSWRSSASSKPDAQPSTGELVALQPVPRLPRPSLRTDWKSGVGCSGSPRRRGEPCCSECSRVALRLPRSGRATTSSRRRGSTSSLAAWSPPPPRRIPLGDRRGTREHSPRGYARLRLRAVARTVLRKRGGVPSGNRELVDVRTAPHRACGVICRLTDVNASCWRPPMAAWDYTRGHSGGAVTDSDVRARIEALETQVQELKSVQDLLMRLLATTRPLASMLEFYGGTEAIERALYGLLDELAANARGPKPRQPTFSYLQMRLAEILPALRGDRAFIQTLIDTLKVDRPPTATCTRTWSATDGRSGTDNQHGGFAMWSLLREVRSTSRKCRVVWSTGDRGARQSAGRATSRRTSFLAAIVHAARQMPTRRRHRALRAGPPSARVQRHGGLGRRHRPREVGVDDRHAFRLESQGFGEQVARLRAKSSAPTTSTSDTATWATTSARRRGRLS